MNNLRYHARAGVIAAMFLIAGCDDKKPEPAAGSSESTKSKAAMDSLSPEDRALVEAQGVCPVTNEPLGSMGTPIKVMVKDQPVFVCCKGCDKKVLKDPDAMLEKVEALKKRNAEKKK